MYDLKTSTKLSFPVANWLYVPEETEQKEDVISVEGWLISNTTEAINREGL